MATNVNALDLAPSTLVSILQSIAVYFEDPIGTDRPLWRDYSRWQGKIDFDIARNNGVLGMATRAGISWGYQDAWFPHNYSEAGRVGMYRTSYHVIYPGEPVIAQADNWYKVHPEIDTIPRVIDLEVSNDEPPEKIAEKTWEMSNVVKSRDGVRPLIYSRYLLINEWLKSWTLDMLQEHYYWLAQYPYLRVYEHAGPPTLPSRLDRRFVVLHQTSDKKAPFPGEVESLSVDWDRWEIGNASEMHQWISYIWGGVAPPPPPPPTARVRSLQDGLRIRKGPGLNYEQVGTLSKGDSRPLYDVYGNDAWAKIGEGEYANIKLYSDRNMTVE